MRKIKIHFFLFFAILIAGKISAQKFGVDFTYVDSISNHFVLDKGWKFHSGDNAEWAKKDFNDSAWEKITKQRFPTMVEIPQEKFTGICWLRLHLKVDSSVTQKSLAFGMIPIGAAEVFVDGKSIGKFGEPGDDEKSESIVVSAGGSAQAVQFGKGEDHVVAIRFSNWKFKNEKGKLFSDLSPIGFSCYIGDWNKYNETRMKSTQVISTILGFLIGFFCALSLLHLLLYLFFRRNRSNLYYSIFSACLFGICLLLSMRIGENNISDSTTVFMNVILIPLLLLSFIGFLHTQFYEKIPKIFWIILIVIFVNIVLRFTLPTISIIFSFLLFLFIGVEAIRVVIIAIRRKKDGAKIIGAGVLIAILFPIISIVVLMIMFGGNANSQTSSTSELSSIVMMILNIMLSSSILSISISMSIYLARQFAQTNKGLEKQIIQVKELSEKMIEQEKEKKKMLESQNEKLELQVAERTAEVVKQKEEIEEKSLKLSEAYKDMRDSIQYAKRIQESILPSDELIQNNFPNSFVLYQPKDIVSGDFYWMHVSSGSGVRSSEKVLDANHSELRTPHSKLFFIAAADCTGHGVPGAFMSTIGCENLNAAVLKSDDVGKILELTNRGMKKMLHQSGTEDSTRDGMDVALISLEFGVRSSENASLNYAGANRPLWIVRNNSALLEEIKATKVAIGGLTENDQQFEKHSVQLNKGDTIYIASDGFADQFSPSDKKLMTKRFKEILISIQTKTMPEQKKHLYDFIEKWRGNVEQVDDILVIGIRI